MAQKELFINSIRQVRIDGHSITPTTVLYREKSHLIGHEAIESCQDPAQLKEDFKVELGKDDPVRASQQRDRSGWTPGRSVLGITKDFIDSILEKANKVIETQGILPPSIIIIAEPLTLSDDEVARDDWLKNYRSAIRRILTGKFAQIDFMPEPFRRGEVAGGLSGTKSGNCRSDAGR